VLLPWYERCYAFYYGLRERGLWRGELFLSSSKRSLQSFFLDQWAFMPTNACLSSVTLHDTDHADGAHYHSPPPPPPPPPQSVWCGMNCGVPAARCFEFSRGGPKSLARMLQEQQHVLMAAAVPGWWKKVARRRRRRRRRVMLSGMPESGRMAPWAAAAAWAWAWSSSAAAWASSSSSSIEMAAQPPQRRVSRFIDQLEDQILLRLGVLLSY
jgi:hypothetical protein